MHLQHLLHVAHDSGPGGLVLGVAVDEDVAGDRALRLAPRDDVHQGRLAGAAAAHKRRQDARLARQREPLREMDEARVKGVGFGMSPCGCSIEFGSGMSEQAHEGGGSRAYRFPCDVHEDDAGIGDGSAKPASLASWALMTASSSGAQTHLEQLQLARHRVSLPFSAAPAGSGTKYRRSCTGMASSTF